MISLKKRQSGFTIVELLIVIVIIGILATLVIVTFSGIQQKARDTKRKTDINALDSHVEAFYANTGNYPTLAAINDATWRSTNMKGLDPAALQDPKGSAQTLAGASTATVYGYSNPTACSGATITDTCTDFVLTATLEAGGGTATYSKQSN